MSRHRAVRNLDLDGATAISALALSTAQLTVLLQMNSMTLPFRTKTRRNIVSDSPVDVKVLAEATNHHSQPESRQPSKVCICAHQWLCLQMTQSQSSTH